MQVVAHRRRHHSRGVVAALEQASVAEEVQREQDFGLDQLELMCRGVAADGQGHRLEGPRDVSGLMNDEVGQLGESERPEGDHVHETTVRSRGVPFAFRNTCYERRDVETKSQPRGMR